ncbi:hypothetical protein IAE22_31755, partial [Bacillus sp. S34]|nr:hypothetical protein [Bacillus sp. S34]
SRWQVVSNSPTPEPQVDGEIATWAFAPTAKISSYITALVAGPYRSVRNPMALAGITQVWTVTQKKTQDKLIVSLYEIVTDEALKPAMNGRVSRVSAPASSHTRREASGADARDSAPQPSMTIGPAGSTATHSAGREA